MAELMFYQKPVILNREKHRQLKYSPRTDFSFSKVTNSVPVTGPEFFEASRDFPVLFSKPGEKGGCFPMVLLSLKPNTHDLLESDGGWKKTYSPAFIRRYPFVMDGNGNICIDEACSSFSEEAGDPLFTEDGKNTEMLDRIAAFIQQFDRGMQATAEFCKALEGQDLLKPFNARVIREAGDTIQLDSLQAVDEKAFLALDDKVVLDWFHKGWVAWVYAHLHSLNALARVARAD